MRALPLVDPSRRTLAGGISVVGQDDPLGEVAHDLEVLLRQRSATRRHSPGHAGLEEGDHVGVALAHDDLGELDDLLLGPIEPVERASLGVDRGLRRVLVLRFVAFGWRGPGCGRQDATSHGDGPAAWVADREDHPISQEILRPAPLVDEAKAGSLKDLVRHPQVLGELVPVIGRPPKLKRSDHVTVVAAAPQIAPRTGGIRRVQESVMVELDRPGDRIEIGRPVLAIAAGVVFVQLDPCPVGQHPDRVDERHAGRLAHERDRIARLLAAEAVEEALLSVHRERRRLLGVERAQPGPTKT